MESVELLFICVSEEYFAMLFFFLNKVLQADGRLVNMSGVFCTNNAQAPSLFSNVTLTSRRSKMIVCMSTYDHLRASAC